jgi:hypothetical protein
MNVNNKTIVVKNMATLKVKNLDQVYSTLKSLAGELKVTGWAADHKGVYFNESDSLLGWFLKNISFLKAGVKDLLVANAYGNGNGYCLYEDRLLVSTEKTGLGLLVVAKIEKYNDNGCHDYSGRYDIEYREEEITFLLKYEEK